MDEHEFFRFAVWLMARADMGKVIPGSGGLRKVRWAAKGHGKSGGVRVIYFWWISDEKILFLDVYAKNEKENLAADELAKLKRKVVP
ncbi:MAG: hypothetical protein EXS31_14610 [Pedosphaera sp.]|nr:hypothetical protein [Pedosphaera sp.]